MAKTVAEIDGDSSGLVSSLDKAKTALGDLGTKGKKSIDDLDKAGKKLSDQLKDVADHAVSVNSLTGNEPVKAFTSFWKALSDTPVTNSELEKREKEVASTDKA